MVPTAPGPAPADTSAGTTSDSAPAGVRRLVGGVFAVGLLSVAVTALLLAGAPAPVAAGAEHSGSIVALVVALALLSELVYVPLQRGDTKEELAFVEVAVVVAALVLPPSVALLAAVVGSTLGRLATRPRLSRTLFNVGTYGLATSAMLLLFTVVRHGEAAFTPWSVLGLLVATGAWSALNFVAVAEIFHEAGGVPRAELLADVQEWALTGTMALGGFAVGVTTVALAVSAPALVPFALFPAVAMWFAYRSAAERARQREQTARLLDFGLALAAPGERGRDEWLPTAVDAVRRIAGSEHAQLLLPPNAPEIRGVTSLGGTTMLLSPDLVPDGWAGAVVFPVELGAAGAGALLLSAEGGRLARDDAALVSALTTAIASAVRAHTAHHALVQETETLRAVVRHSEDGIAVVAADGVVRLWSPALQRMTGVDVTGLPVDTLPGPAAAVLDVPPTGDTRATPVSVDRGGDDRRELSVFVSRATRPDGSDPLGIYTVHDDTATRRAERLKSDFVATISHELRTPITPIKGYAQLLARRGDRMPPERRREALELIAERADHLTRLVDDLLLASRVSGPTTLSVDSAEVDLRQVVRDTVAGFPRLADRVEVELPREPVPVYCDPQRAAQCLSNLLSNADKYTPMDTVVEVVVTAPAPGAPMAVVSVRDHGSGIPFEEQQRVFERFYRIENPWTMRTGGSGLGLHIAAELARAQGGSLTLVSTPGEGCTFALALPGAQPSTSAAGSDSVVLGPTEV